MPLFQSKIDPFSSLTINLGPLYVERAFDSLLTRQGVRDVSTMGDMERFANYLGYLKKKTNPNNRIQYAVIQFYKGHFYHQLANHSGSLEFARHYREKALCSYQTYLELGANHDESWYYGQWQVGMLQEMLQYPWTEAEESLLLASDIDPLRGEANKTIMEHYIRCREWKAAYGYSLIAVERFLEKNPVAHRRWFIDFNAYDWNVLRTHRIISYKMGLLKEKYPVNGTANAQTAPKQGTF